MKLTYKPRKIYRIRIVHNYGMKKVWYSDKVGREYDAYLVPYSNNAPRFQVATALYVNQLDCIVISERIEK